MAVKTKKIEVVPKHIAFIIDGNGRWAKQKGFMRSYGHRKGMERLGEVIEDSFNFGIEVVSVYGFSTENWNRPKDEVEYLFELFREFATKQIEKLCEKNVRVVIMGDYTQFPKEVSDAITNLIKKTAGNTGKVLNMGLNYGSRVEIIKVVNELLQAKKEKVTEKEFSNLLYTRELPDPDFIVRTSGENRLSNFMLWQAAYSELYFPKVYWPDFTKRHLEKALLNFQKRDRRYGAIK